MSKEVKENEVKQSFITKDSAVSVGVVIAMMSLSVWMASSYEIMKGRLYSCEQKISDLSKQIDQQNAEITSHENKGVGGLSHPEGIVNEIEKIKEKMNEKTIDRWKKIDDFLFMKSFCETNKLQMPPHVTADQTAVTGSTIPK
jgi:cell division protein FtsL